MLYLAFSTDSRVQYEADYFGSEYKAQYGRTYLDDFDSIKAQGLRRAAEIRALLGRGKPSSLLDIGCAYGPFLAAAKDLGFEPYGTDISKSALEHVKEKLGLQLPHNKKSKIWLMVLTNMHKWTSQRFKEDSQPDY